jgi:DNA (cytosine-5)-methyltransferase 1
MNHWAMAMETHNANHPNTVHIQADISQYDPRLVRRTVILWASPECTNHSVAKGKKRVVNQPDLFGDELPDEAADRSRATMFDVLRFTERHNYEIVIVENVPDAARWVMFESWLAAMHAMGYLHHIVWLNSMHAQYGGLPAPQSRDRMYVVFWKKGNRRPDFDKFFRPKAYCDGCGEVVNAMQVFKKSEEWGRYRAQYNWRCPKTTCQNRIVEPGWLPASSIIDWNLRGQRIGDRTKPLAPKTIARILAGLQKFGNQPISIDAVRGSKIITPVNVEPFQAQTTSYTRSLLVPVEGREGKEASSVGEPIRTQTTRNETGLLIPAGGSWNDDARPTSDPLRALTTRDTNALLTAPNHMLMEYYGNGKMRDIRNPMPTIPTGDRFAMITTLRGHNAPKGVDEPFDTFAANGTHHGLTEWTVPDIDDCEFRMLEPYEIKEGMAFPKDYIMLGNKRVQVKMAGNAVTPPSARDLYLCVAESLS